MLESSGLSFRVGVGSDASRDPAGTLHCSPGERKSDPWRGSAPVSWAGCARGEPAPSVASGPPVPAAVTSRGSVSRAPGPVMSTGLCAPSRKYLLLSSEKILLGVSGVGQGRSGRQLSSDAGCAKKFACFPVFPGAFPPCSRGWPGAGRGAGGTQGRSGH